MIDISITNTSHICLGDEAEALLAKTVLRLSTWLETAIPEGSTVFTFPAAHRHLLHTINGMERLNKELHRQARMVSSFQNEAA